VHAPESTREVHAAATTANAVARRSERKDVMHSESISDAKLAIDHANAVRDALGVQQMSRVSTRRVATRAHTRTCISMLEMVVTGPEFRCAADRDTVASLRVRAGRNGGALHEHFLEDRFHWPADGRGRAVAPCMRRPFDDG
jgi:hypothetical protein